MGMRISPLLTYGSINELECLPMGIARARESPHFLAGLTIAWIEAPSGGGITKSAAGAAMQTSTDRIETVHNFVNHVFSEDLHAKRVLSLANAALGVVTGASLAVAMIGHALAQARGLAESTPSSRSIAS